MQRVNTQFQQVQYLYKNSRAGLAVNATVAVLITWVLWNRVENDSLIYWLGFFLLVIVARAYKLFLFQKKQPKEADIPMWKAAFMLGSILTALSWGITLWIFAPFNQYETPVFLTFALGGLAAGAAAILGAILSIYFSYVLAIMAPMIIWFLLQDNHLYMVMGGMLTLYIPTLFATGFIYRRVLLDSINLSNQLIDAKEQSEAANMAKSRFLSSMSHELRTPLNAILGFSQLMEMNKNQSEEDRRNISEVLKAGRHLLTLINDLLDIAKIESGNVSLDITTVDCPQVVEECLNLINPLIIKHNIKLLNSTHPAHEVLVKADLFRLKQILINLLSNACKYNRPGGSLQVGFEPSQDNLIRISVADTGPGIPPEKQSELFQSYNRLGQEKSDIEGTGIGLTISKQLVEMMHGNIGFESHPGEGSTFWIELPQAQPGTPQLHG